MSNVARPSQQPDIEQRLAALEAALSLPSAAPAATEQPTPSHDEAAALRRALDRSLYRIHHLCRAYEAHVATIERLTRELAAKPQQQ